MYKKPTGISILISALIWVVISVLIGAGLGLFLGAGGLIVGPVFGLLLGLAQAARNAEEKEKKYEETQKFVMQKVQTGVLLTKEEQELWNSMQAGGKQDEQQRQDKQRKQDERDKTKKLLAESRKDEFGPVPKWCFSRFNRLRSKRLLWKDMTDYMEPGKRKDKYLQKAQSYLNKARAINQKREGIH